jgi:hypothetical protein
MADAILSYDFSFGDVLYGIIVMAPRSLFKGTLNSLHLRKRNRCCVCQHIILHERIRKATENGELFV